MSEGSDENLNIVFLKESGMGWVLYSNCHTPNNLLKIFTKCAMLRTIS